jgi:uncharacterized membrane protein YqgA involved in biofilm formation
MTDDVRTHSGSGRLVSLVVAGVSMAALVVIGFFYFASGLMAPLWAVVGLMIIWVGLMVLGIRWFRSHPWRLPALPVIAVLVWWGVLTLGERLLGWTA